MFLIRIPWDAHTHPPQPWGIAGYIYFTPQLILSEQCYQQSIKRQSIAFSDKVPIFNSAYLAIAVTCSY